MEPFIVSLKTAITATTITLVLGVLIAYKASTLKRGAVLLDAIISLPLVLPPTVSGFFLLMLFGSQGFLGEFFGHFGISFVFTWMGTVLASVIIALPLMYRSAKASFEQFDTSLVDAARTLGLKNRTIFFRIVLPNCLPGILAGTILAFTRTLGEFGATIMIAGNLPGKTQTISIAIYQAVQAGNRTLAYQWVAIIVVISFVCIAAMQLITHKLKERA